MFGGEWPVNFAVQATARVRLVWETVSSHETSVLKQLVEALAAPDRSVMAWNIE